MCFFLMILNGDDNSVPMVMILPPIDRNVDRKTAGY